MQAKIIRILNFFFCLSLLMVPAGFSGIDPSLNDGKAKVYAVKGHAVIIKNGSPIEKKLKAGDEISVGDSVQSGKGTAVSIQFDHGLQNAVRIPAESRVVFESIEPTIIRIEAGAVFNIVDGLAKGSSWKVTTPVAVAAVRGTVFMVRYGISNGDYFAATIDVPDDGKNSTIEISSLTGAESIRVSEGRSLGLKKGQALNEAVPQNLDLSAVQEAADFYAEILTERPSSEEEAMSAAEPIAEFTEKTCDAAGQNCSTQICKMTESGKICEYT